MSLKISQPVGAKLKLSGLKTTSNYIGASVSDSEAQTYLRSVEQIDGQPLEQGVQQAINQFVIECKRFEIWDAIKACGILSGARTLDGALVPLKGPAPTNYNFVQSDYNRKTGLKGDGTSKYIDTNRSNSADPQDSQHLAVYLTERHTSVVKTACVIGSSSSGSSVCSGINHNLFTSFVEVSSRRTSFVPVSINNQLRSHQLIGINRNSSSSYIYGATIPLTGILLVGGFFRTVTISSASLTPVDRNIRLFSATGTDHSNARISFYSIGESIDLSILSRLTISLASAISNTVSA